MADPPPAEVDARTESGLASRLRDAEDVLDAIRSNRVDAFVVASSRGHRVVLADSGVERPYRMMVDGMSEGAATVASDGTVLYLNRRLADMLGAPVESVLGANLFDFVDAPSGSLLRASFDEQARLEWRGEVVMNGAGSTGIPVYLSLAPLVLDDATTVRCVLLTDLREQRRNEALMAAGDLAQRILDQASEAILVCDETGVVRQVNREALRLCGGVDPRGTPFAEAFDLRDAGSDDLTADILAGRVDRLLVEAVSTKGRRSLRISASRLQSGEAGASGTVITLTDLTDLRVATEHLERHARQQRCTADLSRLALADAPLPKLLAATQKAVRMLLDDCRVRFSGMIVPSDGDDGSPRGPWHPGVLRRIIRAGDTVLGEIEVDPGTDRVLRDEDIGFVDNVVSLLCLAAEQQLLNDKLRHQAHHDALTGLPNRLLLEDRLQQAMARASRDGTSVAVLFIDLDRFKHVNDTLGHQAGNAVLDQVGKRLSRHVRETDTVARVGGDEFVVVHADLRRPEDALGVDGAVVEALARPFDVAGRAVQVRATVGISIFPRDGHQTGTLLTKSDRAMYHGKRHGRNMVRFFTEDMTALTTARLEMEHDLQNALASGDIELHFQPQVCARTGALRGLEGLARWRHPQLGWVSPTDFVSVAEDMGLMVDLGTWVLREACRQVAPWIGMEGGPLRVSVNVSPTQLARVDFVDLVSRALRDGGLDAMHLELEVTESIMMHEVDTVRSSLAELRELGVGIALDDFGLGYSSVSYLRSLPLDRLKIDKSFVDSQDDGARSLQDQRAVLSAITTMAQALDLSVTVEGIETRAQLELALSVGADEVQGFLFGRAAPAAGIDWLLTQNPVRWVPGDA